MIINKDLFIFSLPVNTLPCDYIRYF